MLKWPSKITRARADHGGDLGRRVQLGAQPGGRKSTSASCIVAAAARLAAPEDLWHCGAATLCFFFPSSKKRLIKRRGLGHKGELKRCRAAPKTSSTIAPTPVTVPSG